MLQVLMHPHLFNPGKTLLIYKTNAFRLITLVAGHTFIRPLGLAHVRLWGWHDRGQG